MVTNPLTRLRTERGWSTRELALALGLPYTTVWAAERGLYRVLPCSVRAGLNRIGADPDELDSAYRCWREEIARELVGS